MPSQSTRISAAWRFVRSVQDVGKTAVGRSFQRMLMRRLAETALSHSKGGVPARIECPAEVAVAGLFPLQILHFCFTIDDRSMGLVAVETAKRGGLRIKPSTLRELNGVETYGLIGWVDSKPVMAVTAAQNIDTVFVRIGGFGRSIVLQNGVLNAKSAR